MKILVTGGLGFIGGEITHRLITAGADVTVIDALWTNCYEPHEVACRVITKPLRDIAWKGYAFDRVIHCASPVGAVGVLSWKGRLASTIVADTQHVVDGCLQLDADLINISSSEVYGRSGVYQETDDLRIPAVPSTRIEYAIGKIAAETLIRLTTGLRALSVRPFNVVGARQNSAAGFVLPTFCEQALAGVPLTVYGDGTQQRAFTAVEDIARFVCGTPPSQATHGSMPVNVGNPRNETTVITLAEVVRREAGSSSPVEFTSGKAVHGADYEEAEGHRKLPDVARARDLGWEPQMTLTEIVAAALSSTARRALVQEDAAA